MVSPAVRAQKIGGRSALLVAVRSGAVLATPGMTAKLRGVPIALAVVALRRSAKVLLDAMLSESQKNLKRHAAIGAEMKNYAGRHPPAWFVLGAHSVSILAPDSHHSVVLQRL